MKSIETLSSEEIIKKTDLKHIAIIMDGNRRWAKKHLLPSTAGHKKGVDALKSTVQRASDIGLKYMTVYAFSTENWNRKKDEVSFLMKLLKDTFLNEIDEMNENNIKIKVIGDMTQLNQGLQDVIADMEVKTANNNGLNLQIAINYGSKNEIVHATKQIAQQVQSGKLNVEDITQDLIAQNLYTSGIPDPDILVRTGGEQRISNYLLWQIAYSEIFITQKFWPEFGSETLEEIIYEFAHRTRRFGAD